MLKNMIWLNKPPYYSIKNNVLSVKTANKTDFWQETFYGFKRDDGHFLYRKIKGDFTVEVTVIGRYKELYDQAGLMLRVDAKNWVKTGIEFTDDEIHLSAVFTKGYSDWSVMNMPHYARQLRLRLTRHGSAIRIQYLDEKGRWRLMRLGYLDMPDECQVGVMCCSPQREGFEVEFKEYLLLEAISPELHE